MDATTTETRIARVMAELEINQVDLAKLAGTSKSMVNQWLSGLIKSIGPRYAFTLQRKTGYSAEWLMTGEGPARVGSEVLGAPKTTPTVAAEPLPAHAPYHWPFSLINIARVTALSDYERGFVEGKLLAAIEECEVARSSKRQGNGFQ